MAAQTGKPIEIDLSGIELDGIKFFTEEGADGIPAMASATIPPPPCVTPPPCVACTSTQSNFVRR